ncbi:MULTISPECIES: DUF3427 domain-containing protein [unclassified Streptomyces]|uniref:DUF3427 domain-containing protein n=2 Tax=Streptomyces TaxID=1883 RepID=UPI0003C2FA92|nr:MULTISPECIES: DEAD/DEAH box helicase [unclassified Streptomyces]ESQ06031.1 DNA/RNA helicase of DEAD/DEAH box family protein [Streptomyces sp. PVA_94-07]QHV87317.1 DUF3427 domain-containing protein [Streptomyces sp. 604F]
MGAKMAKAGLYDGEQPISGLYEKLITLRVESQLKELPADRWRAISADVGEDAPRVLARHVGKTVHQVLASLPADEQVQAANHILESVSTLQGAREWVDMVAPGPRHLLAIAEQEAKGVYAIRPVNSLSDTALLTNAKGDPSLGFELRAELATADRVDLLCAFVKWHGLRVLEQSLAAARDRDVPVRVITTTYMGATERRALDRLVDEYGAEVRVNYELRSTRLHAKAWLFGRNSGYHTAYVGSSNLSRAALLHGLEWNVRLSSIATPDVIEKFTTTFDSYWNNPSFEPYDPREDGERLDEALAQAGGTRHLAGTWQMNLSGLEVRPYPHQRDMLERLEVERTVRNRHRNLLVAATGTGKTVMAALDYKRLREQAGRDLRLLFLAHRKEILDQSLRTYQEVLADANFGEKQHGGAIPTERRHVFASVQSLHQEALAELAPDHFDVIVIDEFHHGTSRTYRRIVEHFQPGELLGLTATPERSDGKNIQDAYFDGRIAAEMRLWEALENELLSPFHYFGISDGTDLSAVTWRRGAYDPDELSKVLTSGTDRVHLILRALRDKVATPEKMRALGFCVSVAHAHFMARHFREAGLNAVAVSGETPPAEREAALEDLKNGRLHIIFSVDLFNEGLDIPDVDTLLLLRPTSSATVFLQQFGRGLRRTPTKPVLTVLDFIGLHRKEFRFENQFRALTNFTRRRLIHQIEQGFPHLPSGCEIVLESKAKSAVLKNIRDQINVDTRALAKEVAWYGTPKMATYLKESGREIREVYKSNKSSWTYLLREARLLPAAAAPTGEQALLKRMAAFLHVDDRERIDAYRHLLADDAPRYADLSPREQGYARMLFFNLWDNAGGFSTYQEGFDELSRHAAVRAELRQILDHCLATMDHLPIALTGPLSHLPLKVHSSYNRSEMLAALAVARFGGQMPRSFAQGVVESKENQADALLITLEKSEKDFAATIRYRDYAISSTLFHWESQNSTSEHSPTGLRYQEHVARGSHILLFARRYKETDIGTPAPWMFLGPARYTEHRGSRPMAIKWEMEYEMPADLVAYAAVDAK